MLIPLAIASLLLSAPPTLTVSNASAHEQSRATSLTLTQIKDLIAVSAPDAVVAGEINDRGAAFDIDEKTLAELASLGAGPRTLAALRAVKPRGILVVDAHEEIVQLYIDSMLVGRTDGQAALRVPLAAGEHEILIRRYGYAGQSALRRTVEKDLETVVDVASDAPVRVGGNIPLPPKNRDVQPVYPSEARTARAQGAVTMDVVVNTDGTVRDVRVTMSIPALDEAAIEAAKQWVYSPTVIGGARVPVILAATVQFAFDSAPVESRTGINSGAAPVTANREDKARSPVNTGSSAATSQGQTAPTTFPVVHAHRWGRCWGTLIVSTASLRYEQSGAGKDSFEVPMSQVASVGSWSPAYLEVLLTDGRRLHFAHGEMKQIPGDGFTIADLVNL